MDNPNRRFSADQHNEKKNAPTTSPVYYQTFVAPLIDEVLSAKRSCQLIDIADDHTHTQNFVAGHPNAGTIQVTEINPSEPTNLENTADCATAINAMAHNQVDVLKTIFNGLKPGAKCVINFFIPSKNQPYIDFYAKLGFTVTEATTLVTIGEKTEAYPVTIIDIAEDDDKNIDSPGEQSFISSTQAIEKICRQLGFQVVRHQSFHYKSPTINEVMAHDVYVLEKPLTAGIEQPIEDIRQMTTDIIQATEIPTSEEMEPLIERLLDEVLEAYKERGFTVKRPRIKYLDHAALNPNAAAQCPMEIQQLKQSLSIISKIYITQFYATFGLELSMEALDEMIQNADQSENNKEYAKKTLHIDETDIAFYLAARLQAQNLQHIIAHEIWHLIEEDRGIMDSGGFIHEATAEFAAHQICGTTPPPPKNEIYSVSEVLYEHASYHVASSLEGYDDPLSIVVDPEYREWLSAIFATELLPLATEVIKNTYDIDEQTQLVRHLLANHPDFADFVKVPSKANFLAAQRKMNYHKLAEELEQQDLSELIEFYQTIANSLSSL